MSEALFLGGPAHEKWLEVGEGGFVEVPDLPNSTIEAIFTPAVFEAACVPMPTVTYEPVQLKAWGSRGLVYMPVRMSEAERGRLCAERFLSASWLEVML